MSDTETLNDIQVDVEEPRSWAKRLTITVPAERMARERRLIARQLAGRVRLPGFRKGKVPEGIVERRFGPAIDQETVGRVVDQAFKEAIARLDVDPITQGEVEELEYQPGTDLRFKVEFEVRPRIEIAREGGFRVRREVAQVSEEAVDEMVEQLRREHAQWRPLEPGERPQIGDMAEVEVTTLGDGDAAPGEPRTYRIVLGSGHAVPDIEDAIRTLETGQDGEFRIRIDGDGETREQQVRLRLISARHPELPALDDEFARSLGDFDDLDALRDAIRADLEREANAEADRRVRQDLMDQLLEANPFDVPSSMVKNFLDRMFPTGEGEDAEGSAEARAVATPAAERAIKRMLVIEALAEKHGLRASSEEVDARVEAIAERQGRSAAETWARLQKSGRLTALEEEITEDKVFEYLLAQSTVE